jgi:hypothetical protein
MSPEKNPLEIYKILPGTNCGQCFLPSCLAFSAAVVRGDRKLADCPFVKADESQTVKPTVVTTEPYEIMRNEEIKLLQEQVAGLDLPSLADRLGGKMAGDRLVIASLGKNFLVDSRGRVTSECHTHAGITIPLLNYIVYSKGDNPTGSWVSFRELKNGAAMSALFEQRGEKRLQRLADSHTELFDDLIGIFSGTKEKKIFTSDISIVLHPLPKLPLLICYWRPEDDLGSKLNILFDATADRHLTLAWIFELCIGMVSMFEKIARKHL